MHGSQERSWKSTSLSIDGWIWGVDGSDVEPVRATWIAVTETVSHGSTSNRSMAQLLLALVATGRIFFSSLFAFYTSY
jgi:hypothetical protein